MTTEDKPKSPSLDEKMLDPVKSVIDRLEKIVKRAFAANWIQTYTLTNTTSRTPLRFQSDTNNNPITKIEILTTGAGLTLWLNSNKGIVVGAGDIFDNIEVSVIEYQVLGGSADIILYSRVD